LSFSNIIHVTVQSYYAHNFSQIIQISCNSNLLFNLLFLWNSYYYNVNLLLFFLNNFYKILINWYQTLIMCNKSKYVLKYAFFFDDIQSLLMQFFNLFTISKIFCLKCQSIQIFCNWYIFILLWTSVVQYSKHLKVIFLHILIINQIFQIDCQIIRSISNINSVFYQHLMFRNRIT